MFNSCVNNFHGLSLLTQSAFQITAAGLWKIQEQSLAQFIIPVYVQSLDATLCLSLILCTNRFYDQYHPASRFCTINHKNIGSSEIIL